ncbi:MAG: hypothetical protein HOC70_13765 [Gammaproteobacteria bacterium]|jgi:hypothetical protein|nr:hypothetical protein [Gammaproteobacteria bacterium]MBT4494303.1 hypothetical protein [Gammaproteobacteria bacterium]
MNQDVVLEKLQEKVDRVAKLRSIPRMAPEFKKWHRETEVLLQRVFGEDAYQLRDFSEISFVYRGAHMMGDEAPFERRYRAALEEASAILTSIMEEIVEFGLESGTSPTANPLANLELVFSRFHETARQLRSRHANRDTLDIEDEYDVQDLLHGLLRMFFDDIRPEEWTPSYAGKTSRMDFLLKEEKIVVEVKMTRRSLSDGELADQLIVDISRYKPHPDCEQLVCFIYDPDGRIGNTVGLVSDLESDNRELPVRVFVFPKTR